MEQGFAQPAIKGGLFVLRNIAVRQIQAAGLDEGNP
jgi:hypothetical protein